MSSFLMTTVFLCVLLMKYYTVSSVVVNPDIFYQAAIQSVYIVDLTLRKLSDVIHRNVFQSGMFYSLWGFPTKRQTVNDSYMTLNKVILKLWQDNQDLCTEETWVNTHKTSEYIWVDMMEMAEGRRLIVVHAEYVEGWVDGIDFDFKSKTNSAYYHNEMNNEHSIRRETQHIVTEMSTNNSTGMTQFCVV